MTTKQTILIQHSTLQVIFPFSKLQLESAGQTFHHINTRSQLFNYELLVRFLFLALFRLPNLQVQTAGQVSLPRYILWNSAAISAQKTKAMAHHISDTSSMGYFDPRCDADARDYYTNAGRIFAIHSRHVKLL